MRQLVLAGILFVGCQAASAAGFYDGEPEGVRGAPTDTPSQPYVTGDGMTERIMRQRDALRRAREQQLEARGKGALLKQRDEFADANRGLIEQNTGSQKK